MNFSYSIHLHNNETEKVASTQENYDKYKILLCSSLLASSYYYYLAWINVNKWKYN